MLSGFDKIMLLTGNMFPVVFAPSRRNDFSEKEKAKYERIRQLVVEVGKRVGIANPESVSFRITHGMNRNACMVGSVASFSGPVMCLANDYFTAFESPEVLNNPGYMAWKKWLKEIPDHPMEIAEHLSHCKPEDLERIHNFAIQFRSVLTREELQGIAAHEFGHAKHLHSWKRVAYLVPLVAGALMVRHAASSYVDGTIGYLATTLFVSCVMNQVSQIHEKEADCETAVCRAYSKGLASFFKQHTILELTEEKDPGALCKKAKEMIKGFDFGTHPHPAKRVIAALDREEEEAREISVREKAIALLGATLIFLEVAKMAADVWHKIFPPKKKKPATP